MVFAFTDHPVYILAVVVASVSFGCLIGLVARCCYKRGYCGFTARAHDSTVIATNAVPLISDQYSDSGAVNTMPSTGRTDSDTDSDSAI